MKNKEQIKEEVEEILFTWNWEFPKGKKAQDEYYGKVRKEIFDKIVGILE